MLEDKRIVLSGIRATGKMHLGNYFGAIRYFVELSRDPQNHCFYFIANLHTLTTRTDPEALKRDLREIVLDFLAAGIDPNKATIYAQSSIPETTELSWLLACLTPVSVLEKMPHFKEKKDDLEALGLVANAGLLTYPVLMAADILGPRANLVPVGEDQHSHVELARELARRFNQFFGDTFPVPELLKGENIRVPSLTQKGKMGKSNVEGTVLLSDSPKIIEEKFRVATTDPQRKRRTDPGNPTACNVFSFHQLVSKPKEIGYVISGCTTAEIGCLECKHMVSAHVIKLLAPIQERRKELESKKTDFIEELLHNGGVFARKRVSETVSLAKEKTGVPFY